MDKYLKWVLLSVLSIIWGSSFILIKKGLVGLNPLELGALRVFLASLFLLVFGAKHLKYIPKQSWKYVVLTGFFGIFFPAFLFALAETQLDSGVTSVLNSLTPINTFWLGVVFFGATSNKFQFAGVLIGFVGSLILVLAGNDIGESNKIWYAVLVFIASMSYAMNVNLLKKYLNQVPSFSVTVGNFAVLLLPSLAILIYAGYFDSLFVSETTQISSAYILVLALLGTGLANVVFLRLIQLSTPVFATSVTYLIPIVAFGWGLLDNEKFGFTQCFGALVILIGVYVSSKKTQS